MVNSKNNIFYLVVLIFTMITLIVGMTFTYFSLFSKETTDSTKLKTGTLAINYIDGRTFDTYALLPTNEPTLDTKFSVYKKKFSVSSTGTLDQVMDIYMDVTRSDFDSGALYFAIYDSNGNKMNKSSIPNTGRVLLSSNVYLAAGASKTFTVLIWLQDNENNKEYDENDYFVGGFYIDARHAELR